MRPPISRAAVFGDESAAASGPHSSASLVR
ncbi:MAG: hypothetical protein JWM60_2773, partial [Solirubrobacterales bacterium]|nr:hypothetical protein [Solirubrobacterales bacterium]